MEKDKKKSYNKFGYVPYTVEEFRAILRGEEPKPIKKKKEKLDDYL